MAAYGQAVATWTDTTGSWSNSANWSTCAPGACPVVPNNGGGNFYNAVINGTGTDTITFDLGSATVNSLSLGTGETLTDNGLAQTLMLGDPSFPGPSGSLTNNGTINWGNGSNLKVSGALTNNFLGTVNITGLGGLVAARIENLGGTINIDKSNLTLGSYDTNIFEGALHLLNGSIGTIISDVGTFSRFAQVLVDKSSLNVGGVFSMGTTTVNGGTLRVQGDYSAPDSGQLILQGRSSAFVAGSFSNRYRGSTVMDNSSLTVQGSYGGDTTLSNGSILSVNGSLLVGDLSSPFGFGLNSGSSAVVNGDFSTVEAPVTVNESTLSVKGTFTKYGQATITVGPMATLTATNYSQLVPGELNLTDVSGTLVIVNSYQQSAGTTTIENGGLIKAGSFQASGGIVTVNGILDPTAVEIGSGAALQGTGTIVGNVLMGGTITPGSGATGTPGTLTIVGNYEQSGIFNEVIGGASSNGLLNVSGDVTLDSGSLLAITLLAGFNPIGDSFTIMDYNSLTGGFSNGSNFVADGFDWNVTYGSQDIVLTAVSQVPEPGTLPLLATGVLAMCGFAWRKSLAARTTKQI